MAEELSSGGRPIRHGTYPEITWPAVLVGYLVGAVLAVSFGYLSLRLGFSIEGSELAAILGFGILRGIMLLSGGGHLAHLHLFGNEVTAMSKTTFYFVIVVLVLVDVVQSRYQKKLLKLKQAASG